MTSQVHKVIEWELRQFKIRNRTQNEVSQRKTHRFKKKWKHSAESRLRSDLLVPLSARF